MDGDEEFNLQWEDEVVVKNSPRSETPDLEHLQRGSYPNMPSEVIHDTDQMAAENLMYLSQDVVSYTDSTELDPSVECVTEEVITDDWVGHGGQDRVEVPIEHLVYPVSDIKEENDIDVPLPTDQDEYTAMRPWPCDFCSRRFRKKAALMNHMVAHQNDRPHACNLCGVRYVRKCDLMNHLKVHAYVPDTNDGMDYEDMLDDNLIIKSKKKRGRRKKNSEPVENGMWENMTSARTQQWSRRARSPPKPPPTPPSPPSEPSPPTPPPPPADPSRPFVCRHCGIGFAREKALQSHARVHGGDSPVECGSCGELCWSREALAAHARAKHPHQPPRCVQPEPDYAASNSDDDMDFRLSPHAGRDSGSETPAPEKARGPSLFCQDCGVAFQRADLLRRHQAAAHNYYKRHASDSTSSTWGEHACSVCGETCPDALTLLAHAELHTDRSKHAAPRLKKFNRMRNSTSTSSGRFRNPTSSNSKQFPCRECGKVFGSRSSQQIHVRIHTGERPYACRFCWKAFADGGTLRKHERIHTGEKPYACAVCPRAFNQRVVLREHVRSHHSAPDRRVNGEEPCACAVCPRAFNQRVVLREHVRSHHSAPDRRVNGETSYACVVCGRALPSSAELVQHLIQHCDANTALNRQPQSGPRKYKRRRKIKTSSPARSWERSPAASPPRASPPAPRSPAPAARSPSPAPRRRRLPRRAADPPPRPRPKMIHTEEPRPRIKQVRQRRPPRHPADDLRAIRPSLRSATPSPPRSPSPPSPASPASPGAPVKREFKQEPQESPGAFKCEMCSLEFSRRDALLLHVPVHI